MAPFLYLQMNGDIFMRTKNLFYLTTKKGWMIMILLFSAMTAQSVSAQGNTRFRQEFYKDVEPMKLIDPLSYVLGATDKDVPYVYSYADIIKFSGHSCPSVAGAYKMTQIALKELYGDKMPQRGQIKVTMRGAPDYQVNGPIAMVISFITGAAGNTGFKGMKGKFSRYNLLAFDSDNPPAEDVWAQAVFERMDTGKKVDVAYKLGVVPGFPQIGQLMPLVLSGKATPEQMKEFGDFWQKRVRIVLLDPPQGAFVVSHPQ